MKKITLLADGAGWERNLVILRGLGLLHLQKSKRRAPNAERLNVALESLKQALSAVGNKGRDKRMSKPFAPPTFAHGMSWRGLRVAREINRDQSRIRVLDERIAEVRSTLTYSRAIGESDPVILEELAGAGVHTRFYTCSRDALRPLEKDARVHVIAALEGRFIVLLITDDSNETLPLTPLTLPDERKTESELAELLAERRGRKLRLRRNASRTALVRDALQEYENEIQLAQAGAGLKGGAGLRRLTGFCPAYRLGELKREAYLQGWAIVAREPDPGERIPTLVRSAPWSSPFQSVMKFLGVLPGYREYDLNGVFFIFFSIFIAMIVGDAGYGLLMAAGAFVLRRMRGEMRRVSNLLLIAAGATIVWGAVTGVWFGVAAWAEAPPAAWFKLSYLDGFSAGTTSNLMRLCLLLGSVHLTIAHGRVLVSGREKGPRIIARLGWVAIIWGLYALVANLLLRDETLAWAIVLIATGLPCVILFGEQDGRGLMRGFARGLARAPMTLLTGIGGFSDIISYIRLFAVGIATREVAVAFNGLAGNVGFAHAGNAIAFACIIIFGHSVNLLLAGMGVLVHGVRLNLLEFSRQIPLAWDGLAYRPFRLKEVSNNDAH